ncbi:ABC transporter ATP-binding protein [Haloimpatiens sp. FM7330]|uniref:ABC transporter ATP-binding protein n=1 Tax=Haloimpatiens sp. FM7330 TaxID=3298610 RepID=UPI00362B247E
MKRNEILKISNIEKYYGKDGNITKVLKNISFGIEKGEFVGIMGPSGSGKTTLLNVISTIDTVTAGHIYYDDIDITEIADIKLARFRRKNLGFIFQDFNLLDTLTIEENISLALTINNAKANEIDSKVEKITEELGISQILKKFPYEVSGGQKQRCACARALINNPKLILADEPTGALDSKSAQMLLESMNTMNQSLRATILMVTHDPFSASYCKRILFLKDGRIFNELVRGEKTRHQFYSEILEVLSLLGGDSNCAN